MVLCSFIFEEDGISYIANMYLAACENQTDGWLVFGL